MRALNLAALPKEERAAIEAHKAKALARRKTLIARVTSERGPVRAETLRKIRETYGDAVHDDIAKACGLTGDRAPGAPRPSPRRPGRSG